MRKALLGLVGVAASFTLSVAFAADLHIFWDQRCQECHGHAGDFARRHLKVENGRLVGRHHRDDLRRFVGQHEMGPANVDDVYSMLLAQASTAPVYQLKCAGCHQTAAELVRSSLVRLNGQIAGRSNKRGIADFLRQHGNLKPEEMPIVVDSLNRVYGEVHGKQQP